MATGELALRTMNSDLTIEYAEARKVDPVPRRLAEVRLAADRIGSTLRFFHPYGPGGDRFPISRLFHAIRNRQEIRIEGEEGIFLNPVRIDDLVEGVCLAPQSQANGVFHFAGPEQTTLWGLIAKMGEFLQIPPVVRHVPDRPVNRHAGSYGQSRDVLGYTPV